MPIRDFKTPRTDAEWFLFYLFNDPDFLKKKQKITEGLKKVYGDNYSVILMACNSTSTLWAEFTKTTSGKDCLALMEKVSIRFEVPTYI